MYGVLVNIVQTLFTAYWYVLLATAIISWIPELADTQLGRVLNRITDPYLRLFRGFVPSIRLGRMELDLSFLVGVIVLFLAQSIVGKVLNGLLRSMGG